MAEEHWRREDNKDVTSSNCTAPGFQQGRSLNYEHLYYITCATAKTYNSIIF